MILAAGLGLRLRPFTETVPKPLLEVAGQPLIDHALDRLTAAGVADVVVNTHHLAAQLGSHLACRTTPRVTISHEPSLLGTAGGLHKARTHLGNGPFLVINADSLWLDGPEPMLRRLAQLWDDTRMDALLMLVATTRASGMEGIGDFTLTPLGEVGRREPGRLAPFYYGGVQIVHPRLLAGLSDGPADMGPLWHTAIETGRVFGMVHDGIWFHVGTPAGLDAARQSLSNDRVRWIEP